MIVVETANGKIGLDVIKVGEIYRIWVDKSRGKYCSVEITPAELEKICRTFCKERANGKKGGKR